MAAGARLARVLISGWVFSAASSSRATGVPSAPDRQYQHHDPLPFTALRARHAEAARTAMAEYIRHIGEPLVDHLARQGHPQLTGGYGRTRVGPFGDILQSRGAGRG